MEHKIGIDLTVSFNTNEGFFSVNETLKYHFASA